MGLGEDSIPSHLLYLLFSFQSNRGLTLSLHPCPSLDLSLQPKHKRGRESGRFGIHKRAYKTEQTKQGESKQQQKH